MHKTPKSFDEFLKLASRAELKRMLKEIYEATRRAD